MKTNNEFSIEYYDQIIKTAKSKGYKFVTLQEFWSLGCPYEGYFIIRHDLDTKPASLKHVVDCEIANDVHSTIYARVTSNDYNLFDYKTLPLLIDLEASGFEIGLHTSFVEYAEINDFDPKEVLLGELTCMRAFFHKITSVAPHRDINYAYNSLPWLQQHWPWVESLGVNFHAYDDKVVKNTLYVNEGFNPHLCWRDRTPEKAIETGRSIYMLTHSHWWYLKHPFEV